MDNLFELPELPETDWRLRMPARMYEPAWDSCQSGYEESQMLAYAREAQADLIGRLAQMQEHEAIEWLLKARQDWWKS